MDVIQNMVHIMYVDHHPSHSEPITCRSIATQVVGYNGSGLQDKYCKVVGHLTQNCTILKAKRYRYGIYHANH